MRDGEGFCGRGRIPHVTLLLRLCAVEENLIQAVGARRERRGQHRFAAPLDGLLVNVRADDALGLGEIGLLASCVPRTEEIARQRSGIRAAGDAVGQAVRRVRLVVAHPDGGGQFRGVRCHPHVTVAAAAFIDRAGFARDRCPRAGEACARAGRNDGAGLSSDTRTAPTARACRWFRARR